MKIFSLLLAVASITGASAASGSLRGDFEAEVAVPAERNLDAHCVARSSYLGCFKNKNRDRALPYQVSGRGHKAEDCEVECTKKGYTYFAREWKGQCFCSNKSDYDKHGTDGGCDCCDGNVGANKMCVWMAGESAPGCDGNGAASAPYLGCFANRNNNRALPYQVSGRGHSAKDCQNACAAKNMKFFAREWKGQCFCSDDDDYDKHGTTKDCDCCGTNVGGNKMCVWHG